jgi:hypothetical protein
MDPRDSKDDPMEWHRHRIHPLLWKALEAVNGASKPVRQELTAWQQDRKKYLARRPLWSQDRNNRPPWEQSQGK